MGNAITKNLSQIWDQLRSQKATRTDFLDSIQILRFRGVKDLRITLPYPVCVLAGANGCGKSTVLFSLACAYGTGNVTTAMTPAKMFPNFTPRNSTPLADQSDAPELVYGFTSQGQQLSMAWKRGKSKWGTSFFGRKRGNQPVRATYLHTLSKLTNPSEVRSVIQLAQREFESNVIDASNIAFAQRILGYQYAKLTLIKEGRRDLLVAERVGTEGNQIHYSEFHMSAGERAVIRLSIQLSKLENALVLIDEVEAGLHPQVQQLLMLELQRLALRNRLQIICTTHSPVVLDTVPIDARIFLERVSDNVVRREAYRDIIQKALYGRSQDVLSFLCEDEEAENLVRGFLDFLGPKLDLLQNDIEVGRDTGKDQYLSHLETLARFRRLETMVFVLDGDGQGVRQQLEARASTLNQPVRVICLPGADAPELWAWKTIQENTEKYAPFFGLVPEVLASRLMALDSLYGNAADRPTAIAKNKLFTLVEENSRTLPDLFRHLGKAEAESKAGLVDPVVSELENMVRDWRISRS